MGLFDRFNPLKKLYDVAKGKGVTAERGRLDGHKRSVVLDVRLRRVGALMEVRGVIVGAENERVEFVARRNWYNSRNCSVMINETRVNGGDVDVKGAIRLSGLRCKIYVEWHDSKTDRRRRIALNFPASG